MTQYTGPPLSRPARILITVLTIVAPVTVAIAWFFESNAHFDYTFEELRLTHYLPILFANTAVAFVVPIAVIVHSLVLRLRNRGMRVPVRALISGGISLLLALPMLFEAVPWVVYEIDLGHAPNAAETSVSSATLLARAKKFEDATAAKVGTQIIRRDPATGFICELSNGHNGHAFTAIVRMSAPPTQAQIAEVLAYWKSLGYTMTHEEFRYQATTVQQLTPALTVTSAVFEIDVTTGCVTR